jgi:hypothetical protein
MANPAVVPRRRLRRHILAGIALTQPLGPAAVAVLFRYVPISITLLMVVNLVLGVTLG